MMFNNTYIVLCCRADCNYFVIYNYQNYNNNVISVGCSVKSVKNITIILFVGANVVRLSQS